MADGGNPTDVEEPQPSEDPHQDPRPADGSSTTDVEDPQPADGSGGLAEPDTENAAASAVHGSVARGSRQKPADADDSEAKHSVVGALSHSTSLLDLYRPHLTCLVPHAWLNALQEHSISHLAAA